MKAEWQTKMIEDVCHIEYGTRVVHKRDGGSLYPVYGGGGATFHMDTFNRQDRLVIARFEMSEDCIRFVAGKFFLNDSGLTISPKTDNLIRRFVDYKLLSMNNEIYALGRGTAQKNLDVSSFRTMPFSFPSDVNEQQRIVAILDEAFEGISTATANVKKNLNNAHELFESTLQSVFANKGEGWEETKLENLCDIKHGFAFKSEFFSSEGDYVLLTPGNFYEAGGYRDRGEKQKFYSGDIPRGFILGEGDLLVAMTEQAEGLLGSPVLIPESGKFLHNQRLGLVTSKPDVTWLNEFFFYVFNTLEVRKEIHKNASGVKVRHTSPTKIGDVSVCFPTSIAEQRSIVAKLGDIQEETQRLETIYQQKLSALEELKKAILNQAFSGQLTVKAKAAA